MRCERYRKGPAGFLGAALPRALPAKRKRLMKKVMALLALLAFVLAPVASLQAQEGPVRAAYYYKVKWGYQDEFERLFFKNHYPVLQAQMGDKGRITSVEVMKPTYHGDGRADWTFLVVITFANNAAFVGPNEEPAIQRRLYPDQDTFKKEEQRRFEIVDAHWDVPLTRVPPPVPEKR